MLLAEAGEEQLFEVLSIIFLVFAYPDDAVLDDVGHKHFFIRLSTLIVWKKGKCYMENEDIFLISDVFCDKMTIFARKSGCV